jgi:hypothetical protein
MTGSGPAVFWSARSAGAQHDAEVEIGWPDTLLANVMVVRGTYPYPIHFPCQKVIHAKIW